LQLSILTFSRTRRDSRRGEKPFVPAQAVGSKRYSQVMVCYHQIGST